LVLPITRDVGDYGDLGDSSACVPTLAVLLRASAVKLLLFRSRAITAMSAITAIFYDPHSSAGASLLLPATANPWPWG